MYGTVLGVIGELVDIRYSTGVIGELVDVRYSTEGHW